MKSITCRGAESLVEREALGLLTPSEKNVLVAHTAECAACRDAQAATRASVARFRDAFNATATGDRTVAQLRWRVQCDRAQPQQGARWRRRLRPVARIAAALVLALGAARLVLSRLGRDPDAGCACHPWELTGVQPLDAGGLAQPLLCGQSLIALRQVGREKWLTAVSRHTGKKMWHVSAPFEGGPATDGTRVFAWVRGEDGTRQMAAHDAATGRLYWRHPFPDASRVLRPREIVAGEQGVGWVDRNAVTWLDARNGRCRWSAALTPGETPRPKLVIGPGCVVVADAREICARAMKSGERLWTHQLEPGLAGWLEPRISGDANRLAVARTIAPSVDRLTCLDIRSGQTLWKQDTSSPAQHILFQDGMLFVRGQEVKAFDGTAGTPVWSMPASGCSPVTLANGRLYLMAGIKGLLVVDPATGAPLWHADTPASCSGLAVAGRMGYVRTRDGVLHAIQLGDGTAGTKERQAAIAPVRALLLLRANG